ncbi:MAG: hypothetical protein AAGD32_10185 [Planctomycetota bacterium]
MAVVLLLLVTGQLIWWFGWSQVRPAFTQWQERRQIVGNARSNANADWDRGEAAALWTEVSRSIVEFDTTVYLDAETGLPTLAPVDWAPSCMGSWRDPLYVETYQATIKERSADRAPPNARLE